MVSNTSVREQDCWRHPANTQRTDCVATSLPTTASSAWPRAAEHWWRVGRPGSVCGYQGGSILRCGDVIRYRVESDGYVVVPSDAWVDGANFKPGDSGGPYLISPGHLGTNIPMDGVLVGMVSGPGLGESFAVNFASCPCDWFGMGTPALEPWLTSTVGAQNLLLVSQLSHPVARADTEASRLHPLARSVESCRNDLVRVVRDDDSGDLFLKPGQRSLIMPRRSVGIGWNCGGTPERSVCPKGTTHIEVTRTVGSGRVLFDCWRELSGPYAMVPSPSDRGQPDTALLVLEAEERDACRQSDFRLNAGGSSVPVAFGNSSGLLSVTSPTISWTCAGTNETTTCPGSTTKVDAWRNANREHVLMRCYSEVSSVSSGPKYTQLSRERDNCGNSRLTVLFVGSSAVVAKGAQSPRGKVSNRYVRWFCGDSEERTVCPPDTSHVQVEREASGRRLYTTCLRQNW